jgi:hypothetical protein
MLCSNRQCWAQIVTTRAHTACTHEPHTPGGQQSSGQHFCVHSISIHLVSYICPDIPTHSHTRKCTVADMCNGERCLQRCDRHRDLSAIAAPTSPHHRGWWLTWDFSLSVSISSLDPCWCKHIYLPPSRCPAPSPKPPPPQDAFEAGRELASLHTSRDFKGIAVAAFRCKAILRRPDPLVRRSRQ